MTLIFSGFGIVCLQPEHIDTILPRTPYASMTKFDTSDDHRSRIRWHDARGGNTDGWKCYVQIFAGIYTLKGTRFVREWSFVADSERSKQRVTRVDIQVLSNWHMGPGCTISVWDDRNAISQWTARSAPAHPNDSTTDGPRGETI